jgi:protein TonB
MIFYCLRLVVALLTFAVGVAAAWLFSFESPKPSDYHLVAFRPVPAMDAPPPLPMRSCPTKRETVIMGGVLNGKAISKPSPVYPQAAKAARVGGTVSVQITVDEGGRVSEAEATSGPALLRDAAEDAARDARFSPTLLSGQPVKVSGVITYNFLLE